MNERICFKAEKFGENKSLPVLDFLAERYNTNLSTTITSHTTVNHSKRSDAPFSSRR
jgi:hypothetical protein